MGCNILFHLPVQKQDLHKAVFFDQEYEELSGQICGENHSRRHLHDRDINAYSHHLSAII